MEDPVLTNIYIFIFAFPVIFLSLVLVLTAVMTWLVVYPGPFVGKIFKLYDFADMEFKLLLVALAALNFIVCFVVEVSDDVKPGHAVLGQWLHRDVTDVKTLYDAWLRCYTQTKIYP